MPDIEKDFVHMARLAVHGKNDDVAAIFKRTAPSLIRRRPDLSDSISTVLGMLDQTNLSRAAPIALPVDGDSKLELLRWDSSPSVAVRPVWPQVVGTILTEVVGERRMEQRFREAGIEPTRSLLFCGPPGTGKTLAATWLAEQLSVPLLTLDLSAVMSSFLGRTGNNIRIVLDYAQRSPGVLLLDEFDALAKRRDDGLEVGELKRLVTVLLQEIDRWPSHSILIAATNHPNLLDPAVWRRFNRVLEFPMPTEAELAQLLRQLVPETDSSIVPPKILASLLHGHSFSDVTRTVDTASRTALVRDVPVEESMVQVAAGLCKSQSKGMKLVFARRLSEAKVTQRKIAQLTGLSRDTIRRYLNDGSDTQGA